MCAVVLSVGAAAGLAMNALVLAGALNEGRSVASIAENIGKWASQYGGVHVHTQGLTAPIPGNFLTRTDYGTSEAELASHERAGMQQVESYYWKNPALIQREVADVIGASGSATRYRLTARTVLNANNAPNAFELAAMDAMNAVATAKQTTEYWRVEGNELHYARAVVAQKSCLRCHDTPDRTPDFLKTNAQFNGGGGFGYQEGRAAGVISVQVPLPNLGQALLSNLNPAFWAVLGVAGLGLLMLLAWVLRSATMTKASSAP
jgi:hypothetical protein